MQVPTLLITGSPGVGKTSTAVEINDQLAGRSVPNAVIDLDSMAWQWPPSSHFNTDLVFKNLESIWPNYKAHGATHLVLARVIEDRAELSRYRAAIPGAEIVICRLVATDATRVERLQNRMPAGASLDWHIRRTLELERQFESLAIEDFVVESDERSLREVATEVLLRAGWIADVDQGSRTRGR